MSSRRTATRDLHMTIGEVTLGAPEQWHIPSSDFRYSSDFVIVLLASDVFPNESPICNPQNS